MKIYFPKYFCIIFCFLYSFILQNAEANISKTWQEVANSAYRPTNIDQLNKTLSQIPPKYKQTLDQFLEEIANVEVSSKGTQEILKKANLVFPKLQDPEWEGSGYSPEIWSAKLGSQLVLKGLVQQIAQKIKRENSKAEAIQLIQDLKKLNYEEIMITPIPSQTKSAAKKFLDSDLKRELKREWKETPLEKEIWK